MSEEEIKNAIERENICRIAFIDGDYPYISPFQYVFIDNTLYFHFTDYGKKKKILEEYKNNKVCVSIERFEADLSEYYFISIQGELIEILNSKERSKIINQMVKEAGNNFSTEFLVAHGFDKNKGWKSLSADKNVKIYRLDEVGRIGLRSMK
jgi:hypothetical protein